MLFQLEHANIYETWESIVVCGNRLRNAERGCVWMKPAFMAQAYQ